MMMGLLSLDLVAGQAAGRRLVMNFQKETANLSPNIPVEVVYPRRGRLAATKMERKWFE